MVPVRFGRASAAASWLVVAVCLGVSSTALAFPTIAPLVPNRAMTFSEQEGEDRPCITCHNNPDGGLGCVDGSADTDKQPPCFNPFGLMFRDQFNKTWGPAIAAEDADGDGFTNGQELQDPTGTWVFGQPSPGILEHITRPGFEEFSPGNHDDDGDFYCWVGRDLNQDGDCNDSGEQSDDIDCDDKKPTANAGALELCADTADNDCDGLPTSVDPDCAAVVDNDGDGFCENGQDLNGDRDCLDDTEADGPVDCRDDELTVYPGAPVNCLDGFDNDCDGDIDLADTDCNQEDNDGDGWCPFGVDLSVPADGDCLDAGEIDGIVAGDCNDGDVAISPDAAEACTDIFDNDCDGLADFIDSDCRHLVDEDGDGVCPQGEDFDLDGYCAAANEQTGLVDCADDNAERSPTLSENCLDLVDHDCDGLPQAIYDAVLGNVGDEDCVGYLDLDGDHYCPNGEDGQPGTGNGADRDCIDGPESVGPGDCDDTNALVFPGISEICTSDSDTNCNGVADFRDPECLELADLDGDGYCSIGIDLDDDGGCTHANEDTSDVDCDDRESRRSPGNPENCFDRLDNNCDDVVDWDSGDAMCTGDTDADGDGFCPVGVDLNSDGDCLDSGELQEWSDCDDNDPSVFPTASEASAIECTDGIDNDCDGDFDLLDRKDGEKNYLGEDRANCRVYHDDDADGFCPKGRDRNFNQTCLDAGEQGIASEDCDDTRSSAFPGRRETCDDGFDNDCNGLADAFDFPNCVCTGDAECDDGNDCTDDSCSSSGECRNSDSGSCVSPDAGMADAGGAEDAGTGGQSDAGVTEDAGADEPDAAGNDAGDGSVAGGGGDVPPKPGCSALPGRPTGPSSLLLCALALLATATRRRLRRS